MLASGEIGKRLRVVRGVALQHEAAGKPVVVEVVGAEVKDEGPEHPAGDGHDRGGRGQTEDLGGVTLRMSALPRGG